MDYPRGPQNTFRPIRESEDAFHGEITGQPILAAGGGGIAATLTSPPQPNTLSPTSRPGPKLSKGWRQGSDTWSSTGSRQSSRPGSSAQAGSRPPSTHLYCKSGNSSNSDVSVARNFQQLTVSNRRAAFKTQKWSHSFDQTCTTSSPGVPKRRQTSLQQKSLDLDSGYIGSPASGLTPCHYQLTVEEPPNHQQPVDQGKEMEQARRELALLISRQDPLNRSVSLPSFSQSFQGNQATDNRQDIFLCQPCPEPVPAQDELDALDEEIKQIVGDIRCQTVGIISPVPKIQVSRECLKPTPIRTTAVCISPSCCNPSSIEAASHIDRIVLQSASQQCHKVHNSGSWTSETKKIINDTVNASQASIFHSKKTGQLKDLSQFKDLNEEQQVVKALLPSNPVQVEPSVVDQLDGLEKQKFDDLPLVLEDLMQDISDPYDSECKKKNVLGSNTSGEDEPSLMLAVVRTASQTYPLPKLMAEESDQPGLVSRGQVEVRVDLVQDDHGQGESGHAAFIFKPTSQFSSRWLLYYPDWQLFKFNFKGDSSISSQFRYLVLRYCCWNSCFKWICLIMLPFVLGT